jgi:hypothetical protein
MTELAAPTGATGATAGATPLVFMEVRRVPPENNFPRKELPEDIPWSPKKLAAVEA